jgi:hypothetical protein
MAAAQAGAASTAEAVLAEATVAAIANSNGVLGV